MFIILKGFIFNFQRFSAHDGPGIRTTVFFQGCPLRCAWCHNPESLNFDGQKHTIFTVAQAMAKIRRDRQFFEESGGGVTFSGGECLAQIDFLEALAKNCKKEGISVAIDTCGHEAWQSFERILPYCDLFLYDIKILDSQLHQQYTGQDNSLILENLAKLSSAGARIWLRFPIIGGVNLDEGHVNDLWEICCKIRHERAELLPYHPMAEGKLAKMGQGVEDFGFYSPTEADLAKIRGKINKPTSSLRAPCGRWDCGSSPQ